MSAAAITCVKCGRDDIVIRWHKTIGASWEGDAARGYCRSLAEHLHHTCRTCQHDWKGPLTPKVADGTTTGADAPSEVSP